MENSKDRPELGSGPSPVGPEQAQEQGGVEAEGVLAPRPPARATTRGPSMVKATILVTLIVVISLLLALVVLKADSIVHSRGVKVSAAKPAINGKDAELESLRSLVVELRKQAQATNTAMATAPIVRPPAPVHSSVPVSVVGGGIAFGFASSEAGISDVNVHINREGQYSSTRRPIVEIQDDIRELQDKIRDKECDLATDRENAQMDTAVPSRNIWRRHKISTKEVELSRMQAHLGELIAELNGQ